MLDGLFASLASGFAARFGAPFESARVVWPGAASYDSGGSIVAPGEPVTAACSVQFDAATQQMRQDAGFLATDVRIIVLAATLDGALDESARIEVDTGPNAGTWAIVSVTRDPAGIGYECRGRRCP